MPVEIANVIHAMAYLNLQVGPTVERGSGITEIVRVGVGDYELATSIPLNITEGIGLTTLVEGAGQVNVNIRDFSSFGPRNIQLFCLNGSGVAADLGFVQLLLMRLPTQT